MGLGPGSDVPEPVGLGFILRLCIVPELRILSFTLSSGDLDFQDSKTGCADLC